MEEVERIARDHAGRGITEVHIVGGVHPDHGLEYYAEMIRRVRAALPGAAVKAFTAIELSYMIRKAGLTTEEGLRVLRDAGMEAIPGGGAEIFDEEVRSRICPDKGLHGREVVRRAPHGAPHGPAHQLHDPLRPCRARGAPHRPPRPAARASGRDPRIRRLHSAQVPQLRQPDVGDRRGVGDRGPAHAGSEPPLPRQHSPHQGLLGHVRTPETAELALAFGADDIDGTIDDTTKIYSMAGGDRRPRHDRGADALHGRGGRIPCRGSATRTTTNCKAARQT